MGCVSSLANEGACAASSRAVSGSIGPYPSSSPGASSPSRVSTGTVTCTVGRIVAAATWNASPTFGTPCSSRSRATSARTWSGVRGSAPIGSATAGSDGSRTSPVAGRDGVVASAAMRPMRSRISSASTAARCRCSHAMPSRAGSSSIRRSARAAACRSVSVWASTSSRSRRATRRRPAAVSVSARAASAPSSRASASGSRSVVSSMITRACASSSCPARSAASVAGNRFASAQASDTHRIIVRSGTRNAVASSAITARRASSRRRSADRVGAVNAAALSIAHATARLSTSTRIAACIASIRRACTAASTSSPSASSALAAGVHAGAASTASARSAVAVVIPRSYRDSNLCSIPVENSAVY